MSDTNQNTASSISRLLPLLAILAVAVIGFFTLRDYLTFETLREHRETLIAFRDANYVLMSLIFVGVYTVIVVFSLPGAAIASITGGFLFAMFPGTLYNLLAATMGASGIFLAARFGLGAKLAAKMEASEGAIKKVKDGIDENQWSVLFMMRLVPVLPFFVANLIPAFVGVPLHRFVISTFFGIIPGTLVFTSIGNGLGEVFATGETPDLGLIFAPHIILPILGLAALSALPMAIKFFSKSKVTA